MLSGFAMQQQATSFKGNSSTTTFCRQPSKATKLSWLQTSGYLLIHSGRDQNKKAFSQHLLIFSRLVGRIKPTAE
jgi:hypothetical protein